MAKLDKTKQDLLDAWAAKAVKGADKKAEISAATGEVTKPSDTDAMMSALQGELTESVLDAAMAKARKENEKPK
jgi:hypothetical protein